MGFANLKSKARTPSGQSARDDQPQRLGPYPEDFRKMTFLRWFTSQFALTAMFHGFGNVLADGWGYNTRLRWHAHARPQVYRRDANRALTTTVYVKQKLSDLSDPFLHLALRVKGLLSVEPDAATRLAATASAQAYFDRYEARSDGQAEKPNLFQPFWMAKNVVSP